MEAKTIIGGEMFFEIKKYKCAVEIYDCLVRKYTDCKRSYAYAYVPMVKL
jgi:hypothetical protein